MPNTIAAKACNRAHSSNPIQISQPSIPKLEYPKLSKFSKPISLVCDFVEAAIALIPEKRPSPYLQGNCAPVPEFGPQSNLPISGNLPPCLNGEFIRTGPNPMFEPVAGYHWFDGDGMLHGLRIKDGNATYISRYVKTAKLLQEEHYGGAKFVKLGDMKGFLGALFGMIFDLRLQLGALDASNGMGTANTNLVYHNRKLMALHEGDKPYVIQMFEDGSLETVGRLDYDKKLTHRFTAHPKVDPITGEMFFFCHQLDSPFVIYRVVSKEGVIQSPVPITISEPVFMHDFAITENFAIFMDLPCTMGPKNLIEGKFLFSFDSMRSARFGILPRYAVDEQAIRWFELPSCYIFHTANAWEEGDEVVLYACRTNDMYLDLDLNMHQKECVNELYEFRFNLKTGGASQKQLSQGIVEFPRINENYVGRKQRYVYTCIFDYPLKAKGLVKFDLEKENLSGNGSVENIYLYGPGRYGGEAIFIPRTNAKDIDEDDGYLITFVYDETTCKSEVVVIDAKTMSPSPVAVVSLPVRVPYGFHAIFVNEEQLVESKIG